MRIRRKLLIYPQFQITLLVTNLLILVSSYAITALQNFIAFNEFKDMGREFSLAEGHSYYEFIDLQASHLYSRLLISFLITALMSSLITLYLSHKLAGPLVRLKNYLIEVDQKQALPDYVLKFRDGDYLTEFPALVKNAFQALAHQKKDDKSTDDQKSA